MTSKEVISNAGAIKLTEQDSPDTSQLGSNASGPRFGGEKRKKTHLVHFQSL